MSRTTVIINNIKEKLDSVSGLTGIATDLLEILEQQVNGTVDLIKKHFDGASRLHYYGAAYSNASGEGNSANEPSIVKPCASCGGEAIYHINLDGIPEVRCLNCDEYIAGYSKEYVIKMWNGD